METIPGCSLAFPHSARPLLPAPPHTLRFPSSLDFKLSKPGLWVPVSVHSLVVRIFCVVMGKIWGPGDLSLLLGRAPGVGIHIQ